MALASKRGVLLLCFLMIVLVSITIVFADVGSETSNSTSLSEWRTYGRTLDNTRYYPVSINMTNFGLLWVYNTTGQMMYSWPVIANGMVYAANQDGEVYAINSTTGENIWSKTIFGAEWGSYLILVDGLVYVGNARLPNQNDVYDGYLFALNYSTGEQVWNLSYTNTSYSIPVVLDGTMYIVSYNLTYDVGEPVSGTSLLQYLNATTREEIWNKTYDNLIYSPTIGDEMMYTLDIINNRTYALNMSNGDEIWNFSSSMQLGIPVFYDGVVYVSNADNINNYNILFALNGTTGEEIWNYSIGSYPHYPSIANDVVYITKFYGGYVYALNATNGSEIWNNNVTSYATPSSVSDNVLFVGHLESWLYENRSIYALNISDGSVIWSFETEDGSSMEGNDYGAFIADGIIYMSTRGGRVYAFTSLNNTEIYNPRNSTTVANYTIISWETNYPANSTVEYGETTDLGNTTTDWQWVKDHEMKLNGLTGETLYYYNVTSCSSANLCTTEGPYNFTTREVVYGIYFPYSDMDAFNEPEFGPQSELYFDFFNNGTVNDSYTVTLTNYNSVDYAYRDPSSHSNIEAFTWANSTKITVGTAKLGDFVVGLNISSNSDPSVYAAINITYDLSPSEYIDSTLVNFIWTTFEATNCTLNYGKTTGLGTAIQNSTFATAHHEAISNLDFDTVYYYNLTYCNSSGYCLTRSHDFKTDKYIYDVYLGSDVATYARAYIFTVEPGNYTLNYGPYPNWLIKSISGNLPGNYANPTIYGLSPSTTYYFNITACNQTGTCYTQGPYNYTTLDATWSVSMYEEYTGMFFKHKNNETTCMVGEDCAHDLCFSNAGTMIDNYTLATTNHDNITKAELNQTRFENVEWSTWIFGDVVWGKLNLNETMIGDYIVGLNVMSEKYSTVNKSINVTVHIVPFTMPSDINALVMWYTDQAANSTVDYGIDASLGTIETNSTFDTNQSFSLSDLIPNTTYYYNVTWCYSNSTCITRGLYNFTTGLYFKKTYLSIGDGAMYWWNFNQKVFAAPNYFESEYKRLIYMHNNYTSTDNFTLQIINGSLDKFCIEAPCVMGYCSCSENVTREISSYSYVSQDWTFSEFVPGTHPATFFMFSETNPNFNDTYNITHTVYPYRYTTANYAEFMWGSNDPCNSTVEYGETLDLGNTSTDTNFVTNRTHIITGLAENTTYYYNLTWCNSTGSCSFWKGYSFTTPLAYLGLNLKSTGGTTSVSGTGTYADGINFGIYVENNGTVDENYTVTIFNYNNVQVTPSGEFNVTVRRNFKYDIDPEVNQCPNGAYTIGIMARSVSNSSLWHHINWSFSVSLTPPGDSTPPFIPPPTTTSSKTTNETENETIGLPEELEPEANITDVISEIKTALNQSYEILNPINNTTGIIWENLTEEEPVALEINSTEMGVSGIVFQVRNRKTVQSQLTIKMMEGEVPEVVQQVMQQKRIYKCLEINKSNIEDDDLDGNITIRFQVEKTWLQENNISEDNVALWRYTQEWTQLYTWKTGENNNFVFYEASSPGFSLFAIGEAEEVGDEQVPWMNILLLVVLPLVLGIIIISAVFYYKSRETSHIGFYERKI